MVSTVSVNNALFTLYKSNNFILYYRTLRTVKQEYPFSFLCNITLPLHPSIFLSSSIPHSSILLRSISLTRLSKALTCSSRWAVFSTAEPPPGCPTPNKMQTHPRPANRSAVVCVSALLLLRMRPNRPKTALSFSSHKTRLSVDATNRRAMDSSQ